MPVLISVYNQKNVAKGEHGGKLGLREAGGQTVIALWNCQLGGGGTHNFNFQRAVVGVGGKGDREKGKRDWRGVEEGMKMDAKDAFPIVWCAFEQSKRDDEEVMMENKKNTREA